MMSRRNRLAVVTLVVGGLALAGCATETATRTTTTRPQGASGSSASGTAAGRTTSSGASNARSRTGTSGKTATASSPAGTPETTGIPACDDYLSSYVACHRTAGIYTPDQIEGHYETMRDSLLRDSQDPNIRPQLGARCTSLAQTLRQALHGRSCGPASPAAPASNGSTSR